MPKNNNWKTWIYYALMIIIFFIFAYIITQKGNAIETTYALQNHITYKTSQINHYTNWENFQISLTNNTTEPIAILLLQIILILLVSRFFGYLFSKINQPTVIGEILAGIILGPSLLGKFFPEVFNFLFTENTMGNLYILSQIGLILFMFVIGMELNIDNIKHRTSQIIVISHSSIIIPFALGMLLAYFVYLDFAANITRFLPFALFIGISMSITAFPVLARIIQEKGLTKKHLGSISIASAAIDDVTAWCILAVVIAISSTGSIISSLFTILMAITYIAIMLMIIRPFLQKVGQTHQNIETLNKRIVGFIFLILISSAFITQTIGIHALFGSFLAGVIMPTNINFRKLMIEKIEDVSVSLFLPLFFVFTGLRTEIGLLNTPYLWTVCLIFILVAIIGKFVGGALTAKLMGESWRDSLSLGILMNTRGLMELIVLNIGYEMNILPPTIFVMLVIMALVTTFMTTPILNLINKKAIKETKEIQPTNSVLKVLIAIGNPENSKILLKLAKNLFDNIKKVLSISLIHITPSTDTNPIYSDQFAEDSFKSITEEAQLHNLSIETIYKVADNVEAEIVKVANQNNFDFLLVGAGQSLLELSRIKKIPFIKNIKWLNDILDRIPSSSDLLYPGNLIKDKTKYFIEQSNCNVGIFINRYFTDITSVLIILYEKEDLFLLFYSQYLAKNLKVNINILDINNIMSNNNQVISEIDKQFVDKSNIIKVNKITSKMFINYDLVLISYDTLNKLLEIDKRLFKNISSTLVIKHKKDIFH
ncbi:MAG: cation:proton antiporter [Bacteroidales bacterium]|nr:cation:proton antiporter [Bacteroidales bacterium]